MARLPKSMTETPEESKFFADQKAADAVAEPEQEEEVSDVEETQPASDDTPETEEAAEPTEGEGAAEEVDEEGRRVPIGELYAEREKRKELQAKITQLEGTFSRVMERLNQGQQPAPPQPQMPQIPDYASDPVGHVKAKLDQLEQYNNYHNQNLQAQTTQQQLAQAIATSEYQFRQFTEDYDDAVNFAKAKRLAELAVLPESAADPVSALRNEILYTSAHAFNQGKNPAEVFYNYAKVRGWKKSDGNGAAAGNQQPKPKVDTAAKLATIAKGQSSGKSLPRGGAAPPPAITLESLAQMDDTEFDKNFEKFWRKT